MHFIPHMLAYVGIFFVIYLRNFEGTDIINNDPTSKLQCTFVQITRLLG
jgi:hypothetical protein